MGGLYVRFEGGARDHLVQYPRLNVGACHKAVTGSFPRRAVVVKSRGTLTDQVIGGWRVRGGVQLAVAAQETKHYHGHANHYQEHGANEAENPPIGQEYG